jgi:hypothetical protein
MENIRKFTVDIPPSCVSLKDVYQGHGCSRLHLHEVFQEKDGKKDLQPELVSRKYGENSQVRSI